MNRKNFMMLQMQRSTKFGFLLLLVAVMMATGCSASKSIFKKNSCGCPNKKGMVGY